MLTHWCGHVMTMVDRERFRRVPGIYALVDVKTEMGYVGATKDLEGRRDLHLSFLKSGKHHNKHIRELLAEDPRREFCFVVLAVWHRYSSANLGWDEHRAQEQAWPRNLACSSVCPGPNPRTPPQPRI